MTNQLTAEQIRAARALLRLEQTELARRARVSLATLRRIESGAEKPRASTRAVESVRHVLEKAGIEFIENGVRCRRRPRSPAEKAARFRAIMEIAHRSAQLAAEQPGFSESDLNDESGLPA
jgi:predicted transcriptional regulator